MDDQYLSSRYIEEIKSIQKDIIILVKELDYLIYEEKYIVQTGSHGNSITE
jgi:hypothetical protein